MSDRVLYFNQLVNPAFKNKLSAYTYSSNKMSVDEWYKKWCERTNRSGGILISGSIKELLNDFKNDQSKIK